MGFLKRTCMKLSNVVNTEVQCLLELLPVSLCVHLCKRCTTTRIVDNLIYDTLDVPIPLRCVQYTKGSCTLSVGVVGLEN